MGLFLIYKIVFTFFLAMVYQAAYTWEGKLFNFSAMWSVSCPMLLVYLLFIFRLDHIYWQISNWLCCLLGIEWFHFFIYLFICITDFSLHVFISFYKKKKEKKREKRKLESNQIEKYWKDSKGPKGVKVIPKYFLKQQSSVLTWTCFTFIIYLQSETKECQWSIGLPCTDHSTAPKTQVLQIRNFQHSCIHLAITWLILCIAVV